MDLPYQHVQPQPGAYHRDTELLQFNSQNHLDRVRPRQSNRNDVHDLLSTSLVKSLVLNNGGDLLQMVLIARVSPASSILRDSRGLC
jgi:hypothetical protein